MNNIKVIAFEGIDGVGKTLFSSLLYSKLLSLGYNVELWAIDSHNKITKREANCPKLSYKYYINSMVLRLNESKNTNKILIFDRYILSAHGYKYLREKKNVTSRKYNIELEKIYFNGFKKADLTFILTTPLHIRKRNILNKELIHQYDLDSLNIKNITFWEQYYKYTSDSTSIHLKTNMNIDIVEKNILSIVNSKILA
jgi:thymidylate kinase